jgi:arginine N-succinyltransferase
MSTVSKQFIEEMMPQHPIYLDLLSQQVRDGIGKVHEETQPAVAMLKSEGFSATDMVDIFDAGPVISCDTNQIKAVNRCREMRVAKIGEGSKETSKLIVASRAGGFTSVLTDASTDGNQITLGPAGAAALEVEPGSSCFVLPLR